MGRGRQNAQEGEIRRTQKGGIEEQREVKTKTKQKKIQRKRQGKDKEKTKETTRKEQRTDKGKDNLKDIVSLRQLASRFLTDSIIIVLCKIVAL